MLASIGFGEILVIGLLAILIFGPTRGVQLIKDIGRQLSKLRREWNNLEDKVGESLNDTDEK